MSRAVSIATYGYVAEQNILSEPLSVNIVDDNNINVEVD
jgi:hypothetical protein